ncbi:MAG: hypothetical protein MZU97_26375 [Bacillus subtilis]|nr:hypothetical protein [Bacillus subtilis]
MPVYNFENRVCGVLVASDLADPSCDRQTMARDFVHISELISRQAWLFGTFP